MKDNLTEIVFILDESGSMYDLAADTIGGFNSYVEEQRHQPGEAYLTTVAFNTTPRTLHDHVNIKDVPRLTDRDYSPVGGTALMDAIGTTVTSVGKRLANTPENERPSKVIVVITTDGMENSSMEYTHSQIKEMIQHQQDKYSWEFIFIGAGIDAYSEASRIGIGGLHTMSVAADSLGTSNLFNSVTNYTCGLRSGTAVLDESWKVGDLGSEK